MSIRLIAALVFITLCTHHAVAQTDSTGKVKPTVEYTDNHPTYVLGGLTVDPIGNYDEEWLKGCFFQFSFQLPKQLRTAQTGNTFVADLGMSAAVCNRGNKPF